MEFSAQKGRIFAVCRFGKIGLMGEMHATACREGMEVQVSRCGMHQNVPFFEFEPFGDNNQQGATSIEGDNADGTTQTYGVSSS